jgi:spore germination protein KC
MNSGSRRMGSSLNPHLQTNVKGLVSMKKYVLSGILLISLVFSGCWDARELNELALVMAVGIDKAANHEGYEVTVQIARPTERGGGASGGGSGGDTVWIGTAEGDTIIDAIRNIAKFSSRRVMWAHNNVIVIGESLAEEGITPIIDFFSHNPELRMKTWVAVCPGSAKDCVSAQTGMENIPGISIARLYLYNELPSQSVSSDMVKLFRDYKSETIQPIVSVLRLLPPDKSGAGKPQVELSGSAIFKGDKLVGYLAPEETRGLAWIRGEVKNSIVSVECGKKQDIKVAVELRKIKVKKVAKMEDGVPSFKVNITAGGSIVEQDAPLDIGIEELKSQAEKLVNHRIKDEVEASLEKVQKDFNSDVVGLGRTFHIQNKHEWNSGVKEKWPELYSKATIDVEVDINIVDSTLFQIPMKEENIEGDSSNEGKD